MSNEFSVASRRNSSLAIISVAAMTLVGADIATWFIDAPAELWLIRVLRICFELCLAVAVWLTILKNQSLLVISARKRELQTVALESAANAIVITDPDGVIVWVNQAFTELTGYSAEEAVGETPRMLKSWEHDRAFYEQLWSTIRAGKVWRGEIRNRKKDGTVYTEEMTITPVTVGAKITNFIGIKQDITEKRKLEAQYRQAQKMEAIGRLAGGVAHDFNNILAVITGYSEISIEELGDHHPVANNVAQIKSAAERAASLTRQLLAFSRQQVVRPRVINVNEVVEHMGNMLRRLVGDDVSVKLKLSKRIGNVKTDPSQLEQVLMNLMVNARDAMPHGGDITIETRDIVLEASYQSRHEPVVPGPYVMLSVSDTGCGMDDTVKSRIFEPFYTTKEAGKGTGLGLSTVYGIVKQSGGYIWVYSETQKGTTFKIYLPKINEAAQEVSRCLSGSQTHGEGQTILVVEDDDALREFIVTSLQNADYAVLRAANADSAIRLINESHQVIRLLLTDIVMPKTSGVELMNLCRTLLPTLRVILMSGYAAEMLNRYGPVPGDVAFIEKPFTKRELLSAIHAALHLD